MSREFFMTTERIGFSTWKETDMVLATDLWGDKEVTKYICATGVFSRELIRERLQIEMQNQKEYQMSYWPIFNMITNEFIGCCGLRPYCLEKNSYEIGFHIMKNHWQKGYGKEAALKVIWYGFTQLHGRELFAGHNPNNEKSKNLLLKLGFQYVRDEFYKPTGLFHPSYQLKSNL